MKLSYTNFNLDEICNYYEYEIGDRRFRFRFDTYSYYFEINYLNTLNMICNFDLRRSKNKVRFYEL